MMKLYRIEFYELRDVVHEANIIAPNAAAAVVVLREYFSNARVSMVLEIDRLFTDPVYYRDERSIALNAYKYGYFPEIKNK